MGPERLAAEDEAPGTPVDLVAPLGAQTQAVAPPPDGLWSPTPTIDVNSRSQSRHIARQASGPPLILQGLAQPARPKLNTIPTASPSPILFILDEWLRDPEASNGYARNRREISDSATQIACRCGAAQS